MLLRIDRYNYHLHREDARYENKRIYDKKQQRPAGRCAYFATMFKLIPRVRHRGR